MTKPDKIAAALDIASRALAEIASYQTPEQLRRCAERDYGCSYEEALEMAYENMLCTAKAAKKRMPRISPSHS